MSRTDRTVPYGPCLARWAALALAATLASGALAPAPAAAADDPSAVIARLQAEAREAETSPDSLAVKRLYHALTCAGPDPGLPIPGYDSYCKDFRRYVQLYRERFRDQAGPWIAERRPAGLPRTVFYPFSGADLVTSILTYPDALRHVHLSLEPGGPPESLEILSPEDRREGLKLLLEASTGLLTKGDSKTSDLALAHFGYPGAALPIVLLGLATHDASVVSLRYFEVTPDGRIVYHAAGWRQGPPPDGELRVEIDPHYKNFELAFRLPGSDEVRVLQHMAVNLDDRHLTKGRGRGVVTLLEGLGPVAFMTKAASNLLWSDNFSIVRNIILAQAAWMISDTSGVPLMYLDETVWQVTPYGRFSCDFLESRLKGPKWQRVNDDFAALFKRESTGSLPFRFGYVDCRFQNHVLVYARRGAPAP